MSRLLQNAGILLTGDGLAAIFSMLTVLIAARVLGPELFGILVLIQTYVLIVDKLINFQSWQALIKFGADDLARNKRQEFTGLIKFGVLLDSGSALLGSIISAMSIQIIGPLLGWSPHTIWLTTIFSITIVFNVSGTPIAVLRLFDNFKYLALKEVFASIIRLTGVIVAYFMDWGLNAYILIWALSMIAGNIVLIRFALAELKKNGYTKIFSASLTGIFKRYQGLWRFVWTTNLNGSIRMSTRELDTMIVGGLLGYSAVGLYKIAKQFASALGRITDPLYHAIFPELAKLWAQNQGRAFQRLVAQVSLMLGAFALLIWVFVAFTAEFLLRYTVGELYIAAAGVLTWYMLAQAIAIFSIPFQPAMLAMGKPHVTFVVHIGSTVFYFPILLLCLNYAGLAGAGVAYVIYYMVWSLSMFLIGFRMIRYRQAHT